MARETGRAMVWTAIDTPLELREYPLPEVDDDALLVKIRWRASAAPIFTRTRASTWGG